MNKNIEIQKLFFESVRQQLPKHISIVHEISETLGISYDSAYRRLRGDKDLSIEELKTLSKRYRVSVDSLFGMCNSDILFQPFVLGTNDIGFEDWLRWRIIEIQRLNAAASKELVMVARDLPIYFYFDFPELAAFKMFFWKKMLLHIPEYHDKKFNSSSESYRLLDIGKQLLDAYNLIPSCEIWCYETFTKVMKQMVFCAVSGFFLHKNDVLVLFDQLESLIRHMHYQTEQGCKFHFGYEVTDNEEENFFVFFNDILLMDNTVLVQRDDKKSVFMTHNSLDILITTNLAFYNQVEHALRIIMKTGTRISGTSATECNRFFSFIYEKLEEFKHEAVSPFIAM